MTKYNDRGLEMVDEFHRTFGCAIGDRPEVPSFESHAEACLKHYAIEAHDLAAALQGRAEAAARTGDEAGALLLIRLQLCQEELAELADGMLARDPVECLDALTDMTYVADGTYLALGLAPYKVAASEEVHGSNMSKLGEDGQPIISPAGRVVKGPHYREPNLSNVLGAVSAA